MSPLGRASVVDELEVRGRIILPLGAGVRTDTNAADREVNLYVSGATYILQIFDRAAGVWRSVTLS